MALVGLGGIAIWDAIYRVGPGENVVISRLGRPERIESAPGIKVKIPLLEDTQLVSTKDVYHTEGIGRFLTMTKDTHSLNYNAQWYVADTEVFTRATAGRPRSVEIRIDNLLTDELRNRIVKLSQDEVRQLLDAGTGVYSSDERPHREAPFSGVLKTINARVLDFGIELTALGVETDSRPESE
ncbi:MAG: SPFH domain-containing protein [Desulfobacterales bacterium]